MNSVCSTGMLQRWVFRLALCNDTLSMFCTLERHIAYAACSVGYSLHFFGVAVMDKSSIDIPIHFCKNEDCRANAYVFVSQLARL